MNVSKLEITDMLGSKKIHINTPMLILRDIPSKYLKPSMDNSNIFWIDVDKLHYDLEQRVPYIYEFLPVGQIYNNIWKLYLLNICLFKKKKCRKIATILVMVVLHCLIHQKR